jgi:hypothetical protein
MDDKYKTLFHITLSNGSVLGAIQGYGDEFTKEDA